jgi:hypothetical protein
MEERLRALTAAEKQCCFFFEFQVSRVVAQLGLRLGARARRSAGGVAPRLLKRVTITGPDVRME